MTFTDITPEAGWQLNFDRVGYYTHAGRVYLSGVALSTADGATTPLILTVPPAIRPASPVAVDLPVAAESDFTRDIALNFAASYGATLYTDGTLVLDSLPDQAVNTPDPSVYKWLGVSGTWYGRYPRPMYLALLLGGVSWPISGGSDTYTSGSLASHLGGAFTDIDATYSVHGSRVHLGGSVTATSDGAWQVLSSLPSDAKAGLSSGDEFSTEVAVGGQKFPLEIDGTSDAFLDEDYTIKAASDPPPLTWSCPKFQAHESDHGSGPSPQAFQNFISGSSLPGEIEVGSALDYGSYRCDTVDCRMPGGLDPLTVDLDDLLAQCDPAPDWFFLLFDYRVNMIHPANDGVCHGGDFPCGDLVDLGFSYTVSAGAGFSFVLYDGSPVIPGPSPSSIGGYMAPDSPLYTGFTYLDSVAGWPSEQPQMIWKAGQITGSVTITPTGTVNTAGPTLGISILPLWEERQLGLHAGDVVDLTGAGWPGEASPAGSTIAAGTPTTGIIRLG